MKRYLVRVWIPDRPGALGSVASRIGAVRGDLVGIDILERGGGRAIDELAVELPDEGLLDLLVSEMGQVDGVDVEEARLVTEWSHDPRLDALESAAALVEQSSRAALLKALVAHAGADFDADWAAVVALAEEGELMASTGEPPSAAWIAAFVEGSKSSSALTSGDAGPDDVASTVLDGAGAALALGRAHRPFRERERRQLASLARIADTLWLSLPRG